MSDATDINSAGEVVGWSYLPHAEGDEPDRATEWKDGKIIGLGELSGTTSSVAQGINDSGQVVGISWGLSVNENRPLATEWSYGRIIGLLGLPNSVETFAYAINASGEVAGFSLAYVGQETDQSAVVWSPTGHIRVLDDPGYNQAQAQAINDSGEVVGYYYNGGTNEAALWSPTGKLRELDKILGPAWTDTDATGINNAGDIVGIGKYHRGNFESFLLMPVGGASSDRYNVIVPHNESTSLATKVDNSDLGNGH